MEEIVLTKAQQDIFDGVTYQTHNCSGRFDCVIRGYAGTGKSTTISRIISSLEQFGYSIAVTSPTHKANGVLRGMLTDSDVQYGREEQVQVMTIHSFLGLKLVQKKEEQILEHDPQSPNAKKNFDVLIVDETSMVSTDLYMHLIKQAHRLRRAIIMVGDDCQLPPVEPERENVTISCSFGHGINFELTEVLRQALDNPIIALATEVRQCIGTKTHALDIVRNWEVDDDAIMKLRTRMDVIETYYGMLMTDVDETSTASMLRDVGENCNKYKIISYTNKVVDAYNKDIRSLIVDSPDELVQGEPIVFEDTTLTCPYSTQFQTLCPTVVKDCWMGVDCWRMTTNGGDTLYVVGPRTKELYYAHLKNLVTKINLKETNPFTKKPYTWGDYYVLKDKMCVVGYPYATTGHKSQGSTYDSVWLDLAGLSYMGDVDNQARLVYTMITRPKNHLLIKA